MTGRIARTHPPQVRVRKVVPQNDRYMTAAAGACDGVDRIERHASVPARLPAGMPAAMG